MSTKYVESILYFESLLNINRKTGGYTMKDRKELLDQALLWDMLGKSISYGVPILDSLEVVASAFPKYQGKMMEMRDAIAGGKSFYQYFEKNGMDPFDPLVKPFIAVGESTGSLDITLEKVSEYLEREAEFGESPMIDKLKFYNFLALGLDSGLPLINCLGLVSDYSSFPPKEVTTQMVEDIVGEQFSTKETLADYLNRNLSRRFTESLKQNPHLKEEIAQSRKEVEEGYLMTLEQLEQNLSTASDSANCSGKDAIGFCQKPEKYVPEQEGKSFFETAAAKAIARKSSTLAEAMAKHPDYFNSWDVAMVGSGEMGGILDTVMNRMVNYYEKKMRFENS